MLRIDFISDINCPWCALGLAALDAAIRQLGNEILVEVYCQPFELNPQLPAEGVKLKDYLQQNMAWVMRKFAAYTTPSLLAGAN